MNIHVLVENTSNRDTIGSEHGLSLYMEVNGRNIVFDVGASDLFLKNAREMGVDVSQAELLVISHGHYDHGGGLKAFLRENDKANVFVPRKAFEKYYAKRGSEGFTYVGLDESLKENPRMVWCDEYLRMDENMEIFSGVKKRVPFPSSNRDLLAEFGGEMREDPFDHEQYLVIEENSKTILLTGCAHKGVINILEGFRDLKGYLPDVMIGGFHLDSPSGAQEDMGVVDELAQYLLETNTQFYTGHCTGKIPYQRLKERMGEKIHYISGGSELSI